MTNIKIKVVLLVPGPDLDGHETNKTTFFISPTWRDMAFLDIK